MTRTLRKSQKPVERAPGASGALPPTPRGLVGLCHLIRWCGKCADRGRRARMQNDRPCCDNTFAPIDAVDMTRYATHARTSMIF